MKVLLFVVVAAFFGAQADFVRLNLDNEISALVSEINSPRHIRETNPIARATQTALGQALEEKLKDVTDKINSALAKKHHVSKALLEQAQELAEQLKVLGGKYLAATKAIISSVKDKLSGFTDWVAGIFGKRDLFENFDQELLNETVALVLADRGIFDWWANVTDSMSKLLGRFGSKFSDLSAFVKQYAGDLWGKVQGHFDNVKLVAQEYIQHAKDASLAVTKEVLEFLEPYKQDLGSLWGQVVNAANNVKHIALTGTTQSPVPVAVEDEIQAAVLAFRSVFDEEISKRDLDEDKRAVLRAVQTEFGKALESALQTTVNQINDAVEHGKKLTDDMVQKVVNYTELLREQGRGAYNDAKNILSKLTADAKTFIECTLQQLQGIRENCKAYKSLFDNFFKGIFGKRATRALWAKFVDSLRSEFDKFKGKYDDLAAFVKEKLGAAFDKEKPGAGDEEARGHLENIKLMTKTVLANAQEAGEAKLKELKEVVEAYKSDLGELWTQLNAAIKNIG